MNIPQTEVLQFNPVSGHGYHIREAGLTGARELAFTLADGFALCRSRTEREMDVDAFAPENFYSSNFYLDCFEEIAELRAVQEGSKCKEE